LRSRDNLPITDGTAQEERFPPALADHYFDVDERPVEDLISRTAEFARFVRYYSATDPNTQDWKPLFAGDEIVILADIVTNDSTRMEADYRLYNAVSPQKTAEYLIRFALRIDRWCQRLADAPSETGRLMSREIRELIAAKLKDAIDTIARLFPPHPHAASPSYDAAMLRTFHPMWGLARYAAPERPAPGPLPDAQSALLETFYLLVGAVSCLKPLALERIRASRQSGDHNPAVGLFLSFADLMDKARGKANTFTARHRDFYYDDVLRIGPRPQQPDRTFLAFEIQPGRRSLYIPKGTRFTAGKAGGAGEIVYESDSDLEAGDLRVMDLRTLHSVRDPQVSPEYELDYADALRTLTILSPAASPTPSAAEIVCWSIFGADHLEASMSPGQDAAVGFAVASTALRLREGSREVTVTVTLIDSAPAPNPAFGEIFRRNILNCAGLKPEAVLKYKEAALKVLGLAGVTDPARLDPELLPQDPKYIFDVVVGSAFSIGLTTASGWHEVPSYGVSCVPGAQPDRYTISFSFTLGPEAPALSGANPAVHGNEYTTSLPLVRFLLAPAANIYAWSLFCGLQVEQVDIGCHVSDATRLVAWNQFGQLDPTRPFNPFGPLPTTNSYLIVGNYDAAGMNLSSFTMDIEWGELPNSAEGFEEYYRNYDSVFANDSFVGALSVLSDGRWRPTADEPSVTARLFDGKKNSRIGKNRSLSVDVLRYFRRIDPSLPEDQFRYDQRSRLGFFRIDLIAPEDAFGHREYALVLTRTLSENARPSRWLPRETLPLPNPPYTPVINRMAFEFTGSSSIGPGAAQGDGPWAEKVFLKHPFGVETAETNRPWPLLPPYEYNGNLFIGLAGSEASGRLTLLFHLREDSATSIAAEPEPVHWFYLASNQWKPIAETQLISDTTEGFLTSGIVTIDLPEDFDSNHTVMPGDLYWLRVSANKNFPSFCSLYSARAHSVPVTRTPTPDAPLVQPEPLPAGSIKGPVNSIPGLRSVTQPAASNGGREAEKPDQKITRSAERLRHKARAVTPWDYERLVLEAFPEIVKAKCFPAMTTAGERTPVPGSVMVVVVPRQPKYYSNLVFDPMVDAITLKRIRDYLRVCASSHVRLEVRNPAYEEVIVRCTVALKRECVRDRGFWLNRLNQTLVDYLSPWSTIGPKPRFGWTVDGNEVQGFITGLDYIDFVTRFSMLHLTLKVDRDDERRFTLQDTADTPDGALTITPRYPWSLAIPNPHHILETIGNRQGIRPSVTGIGRLEIGNTFTVRNS
jgi:hypothetical protein